MAAIITKDIRIHNARQFVEAPGEVANTQVYLFVGKPDAWANENAPDTPLDTFRAQIDIWDNMIALKRVTGNDVSITIPRNFWTTGTRYAHYDDSVSASNLFRTNFAVLNSSYNVYKCLNNANATSSVEPTGTGLAANNLVYTSDGYTWKYMYTIDPLSWTKFATASFIPVVANAAVTTNSANAKGIYAYRIVNAATSAADNTLLTIVGDGTLANANIRVSGGQITSVNVINPGNNYTIANVTTNLGTGVIEPIIAPPKGHGYDAGDELGGVYAMVNVRLEQTDTDIPVAGVKFRQLGLIKDPYLFGTQNIANVSTLRAFSNVTITGSISNPSSVVSGATMTTNKGANATVVGYSGNIINYVQSRTTSANIAANFRSIDVSDTITIGGLSIGAVSARGNATVVQNSGEIMYIDNRNVISRASDQVESLYVVLEF